MGKTIYSWVRNSKGHKVGVVLASGRSQIGWSLCCKKDKFDKQKALELALVRATENSKEEVPHTIKTSYEKMVKRSKAYFKEIL